MLVRKLLFSVLFLCYCLTSFGAADQVPVTGFVYNQYKQPVAGATVHFSESDKLTVTDESGKFEIINIATGTYTIHISSIGYHALASSVEIKEKNEPFYFTLQQDAALLEKASVIGYSPTQLANRQAYHVTAVDVSKLHNLTTDIAHILNRLPGARLRETGGVGSDFDFSVNGFSGKRVKFFLDGIPMDNFGSSFQINNIPVNLAERIEVYKGVVPVWLGSDALGGAVNIITGNKYRNYLDFSYSFGSFNTHRTNINAALTAKNGLTLRVNAFQNYSDNDYAVTVDAADLRTGRYYPNKRVKRFHDQYHNETVITQIGFVGKKWADQLLAGVTLGKNYKEIQNGARLVSVFGAWHTKGDVVMPTLKYQKKDLFVEGLNVTINANYNLGQEQNIDTVNARFGWLGDSITYRGRGGEGVTPAYYKYRNNMANAMATISYSFGERHHIAVNNVYSYFNRKGGNAFFPDETRYLLPQKADKNILGLSYQYNIDQQWSITGFGKYLYQHSYTRTATSTIANPMDTVYTDLRVNRKKIGYGLATAYYITPSLQIKFSYEKANRLPENEDLFGDLINNEGNVHVKPEYSNNYNLGINYIHRFSDLHSIYAGITGVYWHAQDYIYYTFNTNQNKILAQNIEGVSNMGFEAEIRYSYSQKFTAGLNLTHQNILNRQKHVPGTTALNELYKERVPNIPYLFGNADASVFFKNIFTAADRLSVTYNLMYVHDFYLYWARVGRTDTKHIIPEQLSHDLNLVYTLKNGKYNISMECKNITDKNLYDNFSLQKPGRGFYVKLRYFIH